MRAATGSAHNQRDPAIAHREGDSRQRLSATGACDALARVGPEQGAVGGAVEMFARGVEEASW